MFVFQYPLFVSLVQIKTPNYCERNLILLVTSFIHNNRIDKKGLNSVQINNDKHSGTRGIMENLILTTKQLSKARPLIMLSL